MKRVFKAKLYKEWPKNLGLFSLDQKEKKKRLRQRTWSLSCGRQIRLVLSWKQDRHQLEEPQVGRRDFYFRLELIVMGSELVENRWGWGSGRLGETPSLETFNPTNLQPNGRALGQDVILGILRTRCKFQLDNLHEASSRSFRKGPVWASSYCISVTFSNSRAGGSHIAQSHKPWAVLLLYCYISPYNVIN